MKVIDLIFNIYKTKINLFQFRFDQVGSVYKFTHTAYMIQYALRSSKMVYTILLADGTIRVI